MRKITDFSPSQQILDTFLDQLQDEQTGTIKADSNNDLTSLLAGFDCRIWQDRTGIASAAAPVKIDASINWHDRILFGVYFNLTAAANGLGGANEYNFSALASTLFTGYTGTGGKDGAGSDPTAGNAPVLGAGKYLVQADSTTGNVRLYSSISNNALYIYNATGGTIYPFLILFGSGDVGLH